MAKYEKHRTLSQIASQSLFREFCYYLAELKEPAEIARAISDLLSKQEVNMVARRLRIAVMLLEQKKYKDIERELKVSPPTIARINAWLQESGEGFRLLFERGKKFRVKRSASSEESWRQKKRALPISEWPRAIAEQIMKNANKKEKKEFIEVFNKLEQKGELSKEMQDLRDLLYLT